MSKNKSRKNHTNTKIDSKRKPKNQNGNKGGRNSSVNTSRRKGSVEKSKRKSAPFRDDFNTERKNNMHYGKILGANHEESIKIAFLGGINEIGKNLTVFEYKEEIIIIDCGMSFPDADMPGIDYVIPDITYLTRNKSKIKALFITHGHEDHIGAVPYFLKNINIPVYCTQLTAALIENKLREHRLLDKAEINVIEPGDTVRKGSFAVEAIHVNHSIPDAVAFAIYCDEKIIVHTGDFKIDNTPIDGGVIDLARLAQLGNEGVLCLMSDSTNAERPGFTASEKNVGETLENLFIKAGDRRIIVASFASNIHRIQQIIDSSEKFGRKIFLSGRSLENVTGISMELEYLKAPEGLILPLDKLNNYRDEDVVIITTGSQGEPMSALTRMSLGEHRKVKIGANDFVIISATPIPGNEKAVTNTINELMKLGAEVIYEKTLGIHVSGHASQEEQKLILNLVRPQYFIPVHGEQKHLQKHASLACNVGIDHRNIVIPELGDVIELDEDFIGKTDTVPSGRVYIDSTGVGDVGSTVLRERINLSNDGCIVVTALIDSSTDELYIPLIIDTRGFVYSNSQAEFNDFISDVCQKPLASFRNSETMDTATLEAKLKEAISRAVAGRTKRQPVIFATVLYI